jgi:hypothetical protein
VGCGFAREELKMDEWRAYELVARELMDRLKTGLGLDAVEGKQKFKGASGTDWEIDVVGWRYGELVIVECRRKGRRLEQGQLAEVAYKIQDTGAGGGFTVSPHPLQSGAAKVAESAGIEHIILSADSTPSDYMMRFLGQLFAGKSLHVSQPSEAGLTMTVHRANPDV